MEVPKANTNRMMVRYASYVKHFESWDLKKNYMGEMWKIFTKFWRTFPLSSIKIAVGSYTADYLWFHLLGCLGDFNQEEKNPI